MMHYLHMLRQVRIVHGKGTGALRRGIAEYLKKKSFVKEFRAGEFGEGDAGVNYSKTVEGIKGGYVKTKGSYS